MVSSTPTLEILSEKKSVYALKNLDGHIRDRVVHQNANNVLLSIANVSSKVKFRDLFWRLINWSLDLTILVARGTNLSASCTQRPQS